MPRWMWKAIIRSNSRCFSRSAIASARLALDTKTGSCRRCSSTKLHIPSSVPAWSENCVSKAVVGLYAEITRSCFTAFSIAKSSLTNGASSGPSPNPQAEKSQFTGWRQLSLSIRSSYIDRHPFIESRPPFSPCFPGPAPRGRGKLSQGGRHSKKFFYYDHRVNQKCPTTRRPSASVHVDSGRSVLTNCQGRRLDHSVARSPRVSLFACLQR